MGRKNKLKHFADNLAFKNMFQPDWEELKDNYFMRGRWDADFFKNGNKKTIVVGCCK